MKPTSGFMSLMSVHALTEMRELEEKEMFFAKLGYVVDQCSPQNTLIVLCDFTTSFGIERAGYELCVGIHVFGTRHVNSSLLLNFTKSRRLRIAGSWF